MALFRLHADDVSVCSGLFVRDAFEKVASKGDLYIELVAYILSPLCYEVTSPCMRGLCVFFYPHDAVLVQYMLCTVCDVKAGTETILGLWLIYTALEGNWWHFENNKSVFFLLEL